MSNTKTVMGQASNQYVVPLDITDVFSTYLYTGTGAVHTITNNIDLDGEGGLVWAKIRDTASTNHMLVDTERGVSKAARTNFSSAEQTGTFLDSFNSNGFTLANNFDMNGSGYDIASWTFRKAPKFFTCLTYTGTGPGSAVNEQQVSHDLGAKPGIVIIKRTDATGDWWVFTDVIDGSNDYGYLNQQTAFGNSGNNVATDSVFSVGGVLNTSGATYTAYLFANNNGDGEFGPGGNQDIIKCGSYTGNGSTDGPEVDLGFEPQWLLIKNTGTTSQWRMMDNMRGLPVGGTDISLEANASNSETTDTNTANVDIKPNGFKITTTRGDWNNNGNTIIYMAIRRGPLVKPKSATEVFAMDTGTGTIPTYLAGFPVDMSLNKQVNAVADTRTGTRLTGTNRLVTNSTAAAASDNAFVYDYSDGWSESYANSDHQSWMWKRAPNFFDAVAYTGNGTAGRTVGHNLTVPPEMVWVKVRNAISKDWIVYHKDLDATAPEDKYLKLNENIATLDGRSFWQDTAPTSTEFTVGTNSAVNASGSNYIAYLFASLPGISKVGSYTGNGSSQTIDCGFTSGARFVLIKRTDSSGDWNFYDTERGMAAGNDSRLSLNTTDAADTSNDRVDPSSSGFAVNYIATGTSDSNISGAEYIFYAIA